MNINFKRKYADDTVWTELVSDFLDYTSKKYGYNIDAYDLIALPEAIKANRIGKLCNNNPESLVYRTACVDAIRVMMEKQQFAAETRAKARRVHETSAVYKEQL